MQESSVNNAYSAFLKFAEDHKLEPLKVEYRLWMPDWCGMLDFYGWFNDKLYVIDWKTSKALYRSPRIQTAGYRWAMEDVGYQVDGNAAVRLDKSTGEYEFKDYSKTYNQDWREFLMCKDLYLHRHPIIRKQLNLEGK